MDEQYNHDSFAEFVTDTEIRMIKSSDDPDENLYVFCDTFAKHDPDTVLELIKSTRHIHRHFLGDLAFVIVSYVARSEDYHAHICRHVWQPHYDDVDRILSNVKSPIVSMNERAAHIMINYDHDGIEYLNPYDITFELFSDLQESHNVILYYMDVSKSIDWSENEIKKPSG